MEGIDPYIETIGACHSAYSSVSVAFGRLVAAPTGVRGACRSTYRVGKIYLYKEVHYGYIYRITLQIFG